MIEEIVRCYRLKHSMKIIIPERTWTSVYQWADRYIAGREPEEIRDRNSLGLLRWSLADVVDVYRERERQWHETDVSSLTSSFFRDELLTLMSSRLKLWYPRRDSFLSDQDFVQSYGQRWIANIQNFDEFFDQTVVEHVVRFLDGSWIHWRTQRESVSLSTEIEKETYREWTRLANELECRASVARTMEMHRPVEDEWTIWSVYLRVTCAQQEPFPWRLRHSIQSDVHWAHRSV